MWAIWSAAMSAQTNRISGLIFRRRKVRAVSVIRNKARLAGDGCERGAGGDKCNNGASAAAGYGYKDTARLGYRRHVSGNRSSARLRTAP